jgi:hypothetical protein
VSETAVRPRPITTKQLYHAFVEAGIFQPGEPVKRFVIDADASNAVKLYVERWGDERLLKVALTLEGIEIQGVPA